MAASEWSPCGLVPGARLTDRSGCLGLQFVDRPDHSGRGQQVQRLEVIHLEKEYVHIDDNINIKKNLNSEEDAILY